MYKTGFLMMTALLPTQGHIDLIQFAYTFMEESCNEGELHVMICTRSFEPVPGAVRLNSFKSAFGEDESFIRLVFHEYEDDFALQSPEGHIEFWKWWQTAVATTTSHDQFDYVFASELYGVKLAETLGAQFIPYDINRTINNVKSSDIRKRLTPYISLKEWVNIAQDTRDWLNLRAGSFVLFGQESVGKSTMKEALSLGEWNCTTVDEWARPYLEAVGADLTEEKMHNIWRGQVASQYNALGRSPITIFDTDLLSTIGYMRLKGWRVPEEWIKLYKIYSANHHYFVLSDEEVPFEKNELRYGGNKRETDLKYWTDLLDEFGCSYQVVTGSHFERFTFIENEIHNIFNNRVRNIRNFVRD